MSFYIYSCLEAYYDEIVSDGDDKNNGNRKKEMIVDLRQARIDDKSSGTKPVKYVISNNPIFMLLPLIKD